MRFLDELRDFLRHPVAVPAYDVLEYRRHFLASLERREREGVDEEWLRQQHANLGRKLELFTAALSRHLLHAGIPSSDISDVVKKGISLALNSDERSGSITRTLLLRSAVEQALQKMLRPLEGASHPEERPWRDVAAYAQEIRAVRLRGDELGVTAIGHALLDLNGLDAVKWLLHVEAALSTGPGDPWRVDRGTLRNIIHNARFVLPNVVWLDEREPGLSWVTLFRLSALGVVYLVSEIDGPILEEGYQVHEQMLPILDEIASGEESPMSVLVGAMLEDDLQSRLPGRSPSTVAEATVRQARLVVHEVRNALMPVKVALGSIYRSAQGAGIDDAIATYRQRVDAGLERVLSFATELGEVASLTGEPEEAFDAGAAIRAAIAAVQDESGEAPDLSLPAQIPLLRGVRTRFVLALVNLLRNAYQAAPAASARVAVHVESEGGRLRITIDDNGPGVAPAERERIFRDGYSTRAGGSGQGLALARATIEDDMGGTLACEDGSSLGGARFTITLTPHHGSAA